MVAEEDQTHTYPKPSEIVEELNRMKELGLPITAINLVSYIKSMVSVACMGKLGRLELAGGALAVGFTNITGYSVLSGLSMGMDPICSQAFGSRNLPLVFSALKRTIFLLLIVSVPISILWLNLEHLMVQLKQDSGVARIAGLYCRYALPDLVANSLLHPIRAYFRCKGVSQHLMWCTSISVLFHLPMTVFFTFQLKLGVAGVAAAACCTNFITLFLLVAYTSFFRDCFTERPGQFFPKISMTSIWEKLFQTPETVLPNTAESCCELLPPSPAGGHIQVVAWRTLLKLAALSCVGVCLEWWWYELMTLASGYLHQPRVSLAAAAIVIQTTSLMYTLPITLSSSVSARVGNELGAGRPSRARTAVIVAMALAVLASCFSVLCATLGREAWGRVFTDDHEVLQLTKTVLPIIGLCELANCPQTTGCGILRGSARPAVGAAINLFSFYGVGAPVALVLAFWLDMGFLGLCFGLLAAQVVCAAAVAAVTLRTDWETEAAKAVKLVGSSSSSKDCSTQRQEEEGLLKAVVVMENAFPDLACGKK